MTYAGVPKDGAVSLGCDAPLQELARATLYGILARVFYREMTPEYAKELDGIGFLEMLAEASPGVTVNDLQLSDSESQAVEFTRLFAGPSSHLPPYASVYRKDDNRAGELWGSTTGEVSRFMTHLGLEMAKSGSIPDHISVLFEVMERVIRAKIEAANGSQDETKRKQRCETAGSIERKFFGGYIQPWVQEFLRRVEQAKPSLFYASVVKFARTFLAEEEEVLALQQ
jgi:TorA maturation chaperone TorD